MRRRGLILVSLAAGTIGGLAGLAVMAVVSLFWSHVTLPAMITIPINSAIIAIYQERRRTDVERSRLPPARII